MKEIIQANFAPEAPIDPPPDPTTVAISNGDSVAVIGGTGFPLPGSPGTASVSNGTLHGVQLTV